MVVDIGGGSTELVLRHGRVISAHSMNIGCVRLTERFLHHDPPRADELAAMVACIDGELEIAVRVVPDLSTVGTGCRLLGLAGSVTTLASLALGLPAYDSDKIHRSVLSRRAVDHWCATLAAQTSAARAARPGLASWRADVIVGGAYVLERVMEHFGIEVCIASETDILDGIALSLLP
jgi:exopolyphosphatase/guanosine-5'-triphosphate,3'-diphosphate pyrophosphatase